MRRGSAMFEYMIGNLDWSMRAGPPGERCCHNARLLAGASPAGNLVPVPYDFDFSGLVNPPYAVPPERRRQCPRAALSRLLPPITPRPCRDGRRVSLEAAQRCSAVLDEVPGLDEPVRRRAAAYLEGFFSDIGDDADGRPPSSSKTAS